MKKNECHKEKYKGETAKLGKRNLKTTSFCTGYYIKQYTHLTLINLFKRA